MRRGLLIAVMCGSLLSAQEEAPPAVIQSVELDAGRPYFVPTHPRVTTTIRFPAEIGAPDGSVSVFTEDAVKHSAEYLVTWQQADPYFTITPLRESALANLNVPYQGRTYVFYFYQVTDAMKAVAVVNLSAAADRGKSAGTTPEPSVSALAATKVERAKQGPGTGFVEPTPARLVGFLDRLKLLHATAIGGPLAELVGAMNVQVAVSREESGRRGQGATAGEDGIAGECGSGMNDAGLYQLLLLRAVRDPRMNCVGFICLLRNTSDQVLAFDVNSFGARAGAEYHLQRISSAAPILKPREQVPVYFIIQPKRGSPLLATNEWKLSVDLVSPRQNPGASMARGFGGREGS